MFEIYWILFSILLIVTEESDENTKAIMDDDIRVKREDIITSFGRAAMPSQEVKYFLFSKTIKSYLHYVGINRDIWEYIYSFI